MSRPQTTGRDCRTHPKCVNRIVLTEPSGNFWTLWQSMSQRERSGALKNEPRKVGPLDDAYLAALTEHLALSERMDIPGWTEDKSRFLDQPFFAGGLESLKAILLVESPLAFRRRLIFISADGLARPRRESNRGQRVTVALDV